MVQLAAYTYELLPLVAWVAFGIAVIVLGPLAIITFTLHGTGGALVE